jgi:hypothetical protein
VRGRKNGAPLSSPANGTVPALRPDERALDDCYEALFEALRLWRREPDDPGRKAALLTAYDRKEDALRRVGLEDERLQQLAERPVVPG